MNDTIIDNGIHLYEPTAKAIYNFALNVYGNESKAFIASVEAFVHAFTKINEYKNVPDANLFKLLSIRFLYTYGKKRKITRIWQNKAPGLKLEHQKIPNHNKAELIKKLEPLNYNERFILHLFCFQKLKIDDISRALRLPRFLVTRWLLSAANKVASYNHTGKGH